MSDDVLAAITEAAEQLGMKVGPVIIPTEEDRGRASERLAAQDQALGDLAGTLPAALVEFNPLSRRNNNAWDDRPDKLWLLTPDEYDLLPDGVTLVCIDGKTGVKGIDYIDQDTRAGYIAWGLLNSQLPPEPRDAG
jgi:hypothetical protein